MNKIQVNRGIKANIPTLDIGEPCFTTDTNEFFIGSNTGNINITDKEIIVVDTLPSLNIQDNKIYILSTQNYSMNYYDGSAWHTLSGGSSDDQISKGTTAPTDTTKLWLDITNKINPILKWYNSATTSWINISSGNMIVTNGDGTTYLSDNGIYTKPDMSTLLDKTTYRGTSDGIVKMSDKLSSEISAGNGTLYYKNNFGVVGWYAPPIPTPVNSTMVQLEFENLVTGVPQTQDFSPSLINNKINIQCYELILGTTLTETNAIFNNSLVTNKTDSVLVSSVGLKIKDSYMFNMYYISNPYGYLIKESQEININDFEILTNIK